MVINGFYLTCTLFHRVPQLVQKDFRNLSIDANDKLSHISNKQIDDQLTQGSRVVGMDWAILVKESEAKSNLAKLT